MLFRREVSQRKAKGGLRVLVLKKLVSLVNREVLADVELVNCLSRKWVNVCTTVTLLLLYKVVTNQSREWAIALAKTGLKLQNNALQLKFVQQQIQ